MKTVETLRYHQALREDTPARLPAGALAEGRVNGGDIWPCASGPRSG
jgi:hypothetical protein